MKPTILSVLVDNNYGIVARIAGLFSRRGFSMNSLTGEETHEPNVSRITISVTQKEEEIAQIQKQVEKLVDIKEVTLLDSKTDVVRELALIKVENSEILSQKIKIFTEDYSVKVVDINNNAVIFQLCSSKDNIDQFIEKLRPFNILESARTGVIALESINKSNI
ncbi:MAG: acetolactate synthase small subunit [Epulopiscium sp. Nele67-Bin005]|nr:MAG: acetolactate synthase small subunit [Epulopiscium sp. Nele67-Bin005]